MSGAASLPEVELLGYADRISARPGDAVAVMVSTSAPEVAAALVRFVDGSPNPPTAEARMAPLEPPVTARGRGRRQRSAVGSWAELPLPEGWADGPGVLVRCWILPTTPGDGDDVASTGSVDNVRMVGRLTVTDRRRQVVWALGRAGSDAALAVVLLPDGHVAVEAGGVVVCRTAERVHGRTWYGILVWSDGDRVTLTVSAAVGPWYTVDHTERVEGRVGSVTFARADLMRLATWAADGPGETYSGKIAGPSLATVAEAGVSADLLARPDPLPGRVLAAWDASLETSTDRVVDVGPNGLHGRTHNLPMRAGTGPFWTATSASQGVLTRQHDALHFHTDDIGDAGWVPTVLLSLPPDLASGVYGIRLDAGGTVMHLPLFVRGSGEAPVAFLAPTNTYLAYANHRMFLGNETLHHYIAAHPVEPSDRDTLVLTRPETGRSIYDLHDDGCGVSVASWRRPLVSFEPAAKDWLAAGPRHFAADLYIAGWLERAGTGYEVLTDEDLHRDGLDALRRHRVVVTGSHPEYWSRPMIEALQAYLLGGGKLMYLGGNGFYWMTSFGPDLSYIEVRRGNAGSRAWDSDPGEAVHATTGEAGGLWRNLGICPQSLVGVGMAAQGWGGGRGYRRLPDSLDPRVQPFFEGIGLNETIGSFGYVMCGAAGDEVDRIDRALGTPPHALRLATSLTLPDEYQLTVEEVRNMTPGFGGTKCEEVRSDLVWFDLRGGGEVFSVGSVSWAAAIGWNGGDNNVDRLSTNVLRSFLARPSPGRATAPVVEPVTDG